MIELDGGIPAIKTAPELSVVVPCFNEAEAIDELYERVAQVCRRSGCTYEILLVNDGSTDATWSKIVAFADGDPQLVGVSLARNYGHQLALTAGLSMCQGDRILIIDADLQDPPELLADMMRLMDEGADVVYGVRLQRQGETRFKRLTAQVFYRLLVSLVDFPIPVDSGDFRLLSRRALVALNSMPEQHRFIRGMVSWIGFRQVALPYERQARVAGTTKYPLRKMMMLAVDAITGFSIKPLRLASYLGFGFGALAGVSLAYTLYSWMFYEAAAGWTSLMTITLVMGSAQLLILGVMGEYLGRTYLEAKRRPMFLVDEVVSRPALAASNAASSMAREPVQRSNQAASR